MADARPCRYVASSLEMVGLGALAAGALNRGPWCVIKWAAYRQLVRTDQGVDDKLNMNLTGCQLGIALHNPGTQPGALPLLSLLPDPSTLGAAPAHSLVSS